MAIRRFRTVIKLVLQGPVESFEDYESRLQDIVDKINDRPGVVQECICLPSADQSGRMCCVVQWKQIKKKTNKKIKKSK